jgi:lysyl-tRNA synthetase class 2
LDQLRRLQPLSEPSPRTKEATASPLIEARAKKIRDLEKLGIPAFAAGFTPDILSDTFKTKFAEVTESQPSDQVVRMAGRIMALRILGKASFLRVQDDSGQFQAYLARDTLGPEDYKLVKKLDVGDIIGVEGRHHADGMKADGRPG